MSHREIILKSIKRARIGLITHRLWHGVWRGVLAGGCAALLWFGIYKVFPIPGHFLDEGFLVSGAVGVVVMLVHGLRSMSRRKVAEYLDSSQHLNERLSTALELADENSESPWIELIEKDAAKAANGIRWKELVRWTFPVSGRWALAVIAGIIGLGFVPEYRTTEFLEEEKNRDIIQDTGRELVKVLKTSYEKRPKPLDAANEKFLEEGIALGNELSEARLKKNGALRKLDDFTTRIQDEINRMTDDPSQRRMKEMAQSGKAMDSSTASEMVKQMEAMREKLGEAAGQADKLSQMRDQLSQMQDMARQMEEALKNPNSEASRQLAEAMKDLEDQFRQMGMDSEAFRKAMEALKNGDTDAFAENMNLAMNDMEKMLEMAQALQQMEQQIGKDLAEQLERGQVAAAMESLDQLAEKLADPNLTEEEREEIARQLEEAADQAQGFDELQKNLQEAADQARQGNAEEARQAIAKAQENLDDLMESMQNAQNLQQMMNAMKKAGAAIGAGKKWGRMKGQGQGQGQGRGPGQGQGLGGGFGKWSDGSDPLPAEKTELQDQSNMFQQDDEARGISDRDDSFEANRFSPDQIKGDISPGSSMPSMPLKGVHIKGQSKATFQEVIDQIQNSEAESVDQTRIPRAYQDAVKSYFDE